MLWDVFGTIWKVFLRNFDGHLDSWNWSSIPRVMVWIKFMILSGVYWFKCCSGWESDLIGSSGLILERLSASTNFLLIVPFSLLLNFSIRGYFLYLFSFAIFLNSWTYSLHVLPLCFIVLNCSTFLFSSAVFSNSFLILLNNSSAIFTSDSPFDNFYTVSLSGQQYKLMTDYYLLHSKSKILSLDIYERELTKQILSQWSTI